MAQAKAKLSSYRQSPRKVRLIADLVRGKKVDEAINLLSFTPKRAADPVKKLIFSAKANAQNLSLPVENLIIKEISVDEGSTLYRRRPRSRGMANPIRKRTSHINITLAEGQPKKQKRDKKQETKNNAETASSKLEASN